MHHLYIETKISAISEKEPTVWHCRK